VRAVRQRVGHVRAQLSVIDREQSGDVGIVHGAETR
jgi:hypothetical protein